MKQAYVDKKFKAASLEIIDQANGIITEYDRKGLSLTLRQLYYQFVARDIIPNKQSEYKRLGSIINDARLAGLVSWYAIEDRTRSLRGVYTYAHPGDLIESMIDEYKINLWKRQDHHIEVWIEKDALVGVISRICNEFRVDFFACRGYTSQSEQWRAGKRMIRALQEGKEVTILHLGDHDPSGIDMTRDNLERLLMFINGDDLWNVDSGRFNVQRLALNMDQVEEYNPPPNPAKFTDSRAMGYVAEYGTSSWELDALDPEVIEQLIRSEIEQRIDYNLWDEDVEREEQDTEKLRDFARQFEGE